MVDFVIRQLLSPHFAPEELEFLKLPHYEDTA